MLALIIPLLLYGESDKLKNNWFNIGSTVSSQTIEIISNSSFF